MENKTYEPIENFYPELVDGFPTFAKELSSFLERNHGKVANLSTPVSELVQYVKELQELAVLLAQGIKSEKLDPKTLYRLATAPSRKVGNVRRGDPRPVGTIPGNHMYHVLYQEQAEIGCNFLLLNQRVPSKVDTGAEVHAVNSDHDGNLVPAEGGGVEIHVPLTDGITYRVNNVGFQPKALGGIAIALPGDLHSLEKTLLERAARSLIVCAFGFGKYAKKVKPEIPTMVTGFGNVPVGSFSEIPRFIQI